MFEPYGPSHWATIAVFVIGAGLLVWTGRRQTDEQARRLGRILGALTAVDLRRDAYLHPYPADDRLLCRCN